MLGRARVVFALLVGIGGCHGNRQAGPVINDTSDLSFMSATDLANGGCGTANYEAHQAPAALLVLLDTSQSMGENGKYTAAAQAIVQAIDQDVFDTMSIGLMAAPSQQIA